MKRKHCMIVQAVLLCWFFLDMTGVYFGDVCLVTRSYKDDWIFFLIYLVAVILFVVKEKVGKWAVIIWTSMWFATQFISHEWYTIFNDGFMGTIESKIEVFSGTMHWMKIDGRYVLDTYHTILHILILLVLVSTSMYAAKNRKSNSTIKMPRRN